MFLMLMATNKVVNIDDASDYEIISVTLITPRNNQQSNEKPLSLLLQQIQKLILIIKNRNK